MPTKQHNMKRFDFMMLLGALMCVSAAFAQDTSIIPPEIGNFIGLGTFAALVAVIPVAVELIKRLIPGMSHLATQIMSWAVGIVITLISWLLHFGFLAGLEWYVMLLYGIGASLAANGIFDIGFISGLFDKIFGKKP